ncbi:hypothetical protein MT997_22810 [Paenibacillus sp. OVF10]|nr:hypothetical protein MT997_22810 [Paenibacillus sp. OVF10]
MAGINPVEEAPGFQRVELVPQPDNRLKWVKATVETASGTYRSGWEIDKEGRLDFTFDIPFNASARIRLPHAHLKDLEINGVTWEFTDITGEQLEEEVLLELFSGSYSISYSPTKSYLRIFSTKTPLIELLHHNEAAPLIRTMMSEQVKVNPDDLGASIGNSSLRDLAAFYSLPTHILDQMDERLSQIK